METIAKEVIFGRFPNGDLFEIRIEIGAPYSWQGDEDEWACPVKLHPLYPNLRDIHGGSSLQALCLAISLAKSLLDAFLEKGGELTYGENGTFDVNAVFGTTKH
ncbi:hypothetical protein [Dyella humicola]|uniref:hypothetical protein n=1 Tax=Dyella humicola TaxID=2992126 RepID=UPI00225C2CEF|nr:hypothetical protein [Dyella humicola]